MLEGVFQDEHGDFPAGCYIRNPPTSRHTPGSAPGCVLFVKLWQFDPADRTQVRIDAGDQAFVTDPDRDGVGTLTLFQDARETVRLERWPADADISLPPCGGVELLVLRGRFEESGERFEAQSWLRLPPAMRLAARTGPDGLPGLDQDRSPCPSRRAAARGVLINSGTAEQPSPWRGVRRACHHASVG